MKKIISILMLAMAILISGASMEAKTTKKSGKRSSTTTTAKVATNSYGDYLLTGHKYKGTVQGVSMTFDFIDPYTVYVYAKHGYDEEVQSWGWRSSGDRLQIGEMVFIISDSGRTLTSTSSSTFKLKLVK